MAIAIYLGLIFILLSVEFRKKALKIDALSFFHVFFLVSYLIPGLLWSVYPENELWDRYALGYNPASTAPVLLSIACSYLLVVSSFLVIQRFKPTYYLSIQLKPATTNLYYAYSAILLLLILISIWSAGGVGEYVKKAIAHRHREPSYGIGSYLKYFIFPSSLIMLGLFLMAKDTKGLRRTFYLLFNCLFVIFTGVFIVSTGGRENVLIVVVLAAMLYYALKQRLSVRLLILLAGGLLLSFFVMAYYRDVTFLWSKKDVRLTEIVLDEKLSVVDYLLTVFSYYQHYFYTIYESFYDSEAYNFPRLGLDWIRVFFTLIPGVSIDELDLLHVSSVPDVINIQQFGGGPGYIPPGWIGLALMNGGLLWLGFKSILIGATASILSNKNYRNIDKDSRVIFFYFLVFYLWHMLSIVNAPLNSGANYLGYYILVCLIPLMARVTLKRA